MLFLGIYRFVRREKGQTVIKLLVSLIVWGGLLVISIFPHIIDKLGGLLGIQGATNGIIFLAFLFLFFISFRLLRVVERIEENLTTLVRKLALKDLKKK